MLLHKDTRPMGMESNLKPGRSSGLKPDTRPNAYLDFLGVLRRIAAACSGVVDEIRESTSEGNRILIPSPNAVSWGCDSMRGQFAEGAGGLQTPEDGWRIDEPSGTGRIPVAHRRPEAKAHRSCVCFRGLKTPAPSARTSKNLPQRSHLKNCGEI